MEFLPQFPLKLVAFPGEHVNLHIFEDRYKELFADVEQQRLTFGLVAYIDNNVMPVGTEMRLIQVSKRHPNGEMDIKTEGIGRYKIHEFMPEAPNKLYAGGKIERLNDNYECDILLRQQIIDKIQDLYLSLNVKKAIPENNNNFTAFKLAHNVGFTLDQEYEMLTMKEEQDRQEYLLNHLIHIIPTVKEMEDIRQKASMNGHFKNILPPEF